MPKSFNNRVANGGRVRTKALMEVLHESNRKIPYTLNKKRWIIFEPKDSCSSCKSKLKWKWGKQNLGYPFCEENTRKVFVQICSNKECGRAYVAAFEKLKK